MGWRRIDDCWVHSMENKGKRGDVLGWDWNTYSRGMKAFLALELFVAVAVLLLDMVSITN